MDRDPDGARVEGESAFRALAAVAHQHLPGEARPDADRAGIARVRERIAGRGARGWFTGWKLAFPAAAFAAGLTAFAVMKLRVSYETSGATVDGAGVIAAERGPSFVRFSDGTEVALEKDARGRVSEVGFRGARVALHEGRARVKVAKRPRARWAFDAGPYEVIVTGTSFDLRWSRRDRRLELELLTGSVLVRGPYAGSGIAVVAGQTLIASPDDRRIDVAPTGEVGRRDGLAAGPVIVPLPSPAPSERPVERPDGRPAPRASDRAAARPLPPSWTKRIAAGDHEGVLADAEKRGLAQVLATVSSGDLAALADAARYGGRDDVARRALMAQRKRFSGTPRASDAAFLLGRLAEDGAKDAKEALRFYDLYLEESAAGSYSAEALGRKMALTRRTGGREAACPIARDYLRRHPAGPYARLARSICP